jgi:hypothetical protein
VPYLSLYGVFVDVRAARVAISILGFLIFVYHMWLCPEFSVLLPILGICDVKGSLLI